MTKRNQMAADIWPHLAADRPAPREQRREPSELAKLMFPAHVPKRPPAPNPLRDSLLRNLRDLNQRARGR
jgi:hypothetical protein